MDDWDGGWRTRFCPAATAADKLGRLITSQKLLASAGYRWAWGGGGGGAGGATTLLLMRCGVFQGASRLSGWRLDHQDGSRCRRAPLAPG